VHKQLSRQAKVVEQDALQDADVIDKILEQMGDLSGGGAGVIEAEAGDGDAAAGGTTRRAAHAAQGGGETEISDAPPDQSTPRSVGSRRGGRGGRVGGKG